ncbi:hypothetical protein [Sphingomonas panaciterrae]|uniref:hypothetical protein n=1 Tax=Sphingomonas panaciterrae TaxID=1462999 RepID=UPI002FF02FAA
MDDDDLRVVVVWPDAKEYARFRAVCGDDYPDTYLEFLAQAEGRIRAVEATGKVVERVVVDPDEMVEWCIANHGEVNSATRANFALNKVLERNKRPDRMH